MGTAISRRQLLSAAGVGSAGVLFSRNIAFGQLVDPIATESAQKRVSEPRMQTGPAGLELTVVAVSPRMLRVTVAAIRESVDLYYDDDSLMAGHFILDRCGICLICQRSQPCQGNCSDRLREFPALDDAHRKGGELGFTRGA